MSRKAGTIQGCSLGGELMRARSNDTSCYQAMVDLLDGSITHPDSRGFDIEVVPGENNKVSRFVITDFNTYGFQGIEKDGPENPFTFARKTDVHKNDDFVSEFGIGFKMASLKLCDYMEIITNSKNEEDDKRVYWQIKFPWQEMIHNSYGNDFNSAKTKEIDRIRFLEDHKDKEFGSTIILDKLVSNDLTRNATHARKILYDIFSRSYKGYLESGYRKIRIKGLSDVKPHKIPFDILDYYHPKYITEIKVVIDKDCSDLNKKIVAILVKDISESATHSKARLYKNDKPYSKIIIY